MAGNKKSEQAEPRSAKREVYDWLECLVTALMFSVLLFVFVARIIGVIGGSMQPTFYEGYKVITSNLFYEPKQGDIVVLTKESFDDDAIVKRIIATEGQTVDIDFSTGDVRVDGVLLSENYISGPTTTRLDFTGPVTVPEGHVFVLGDNRNGSTDSRDARIGCVDERCIIGRAFAVLYPFSEIGAVG